VVHQDGLTKNTDGGITMILPIHWSMVLMGISMLGEQLEIVLQVKISPGILLANSAF